MLSSTSFQPSYEIVFVANNNIEEIKILKSNL